MSPCTCAEISFRCPSHDRRVMSFYPEVLQVYRIPYVQLQSKFLLLRVWGYALRSMHPPQLPWTHNYMIRCQATCVWIFRLGYWPCMVPPFASKHQCVRERFQQAVTDFIARDLFTVLWMGAFFLLLFLQFR